jgi:hypothetical protein
MAVTVRVEVNAVAVVGAKVTWIVQVPLAARVAGLTGQLFVCLSEGSPVAMLEIVNANEEEVLVNVTVFAVLVVPVC